jgi:hypothetical protein
VTLLSSCGIFSSEGQRQEQHFHWAASQDQQVGMPAVTESFRLPAS